MAYLDYSGKVYEFDLQEGYSDYAVVLRVAEGTVSTDLNTGKTAKIRILTADGEYTTLEVNENNLPAINLYLKYGFKNVGFRKKYYKNRDSAIIMTKDL